MRYSKMNTTLSKILSTSKETCSLTTTKMMSMEIVEAAEKIRDPTSSKFTIKAKGARPQEKKLKRIALKMDRLNTNRMKIKRTLHCPVKVTNL